MVPLGERLAVVFPEAEIGVSADGCPVLRVPASRVAEALRLARDELGYNRFVDLTAVDEPSREERFELNYLLYTMAEHAWLRIKARTAGSAPSAVEVFPGLNWYEREVFDMFGVRFDGHPNLTRLLMPDDWQGHPLRRDEAVGGEPVDFTVTRELYGT